MTSVEQGILKQNLSLLFKGQILNTDWSRPWPPKGRTYATYMYVCTLCIVAKRCVL